MNLKLTIIIILLSFTKTTEIINLEDIEAHFWKQMNPAVTLYSEEVVFNSKTKLKTHMFKLKSNKKEHMLDISINKKDNDILIRFSRHKKENIEKRIKKYDDKQIEIQSKVFPELIRRLVSVDDLAFDILYFNMIEDIKEEILKLADNQMLRFEESFVDDSVRLELYYGNTYLAFFKITSIEKEANKFFLNVEFTVSEKNKEETSLTEIEVLSYDIEHFESKMKFITSKLILKDFINCSDNVLEQFEIYSKLNYKSDIIFSKIGEGSNEKLKNFSLTSKDDFVTGFIVYIDPPKNSNDVGFYQIKLQLNGSDLIDKNFKRMSNNDFKKFLDALMISSHFSTLYEKVKKNFEESIKLIYGENAKNLIFLEKHQTRFLRNTIYRDFAIFKQENLLVLNFLESSDIVEIKLTTDSLFLNNLSIQFNTRTYNSDIIGIFFTNSFNLILQSKKIQNNQQSKSSSIKMSQIRKTI